jgi:hypothetical protein
MIGDRWRDIDCGTASGCKTIFIDWDYQEAASRAFVARFERRSQKCPGNQNSVSAPLICSSF